MGKQLVLIDDLLQMEDLLKGAYRDVLTKCGKPNCWCVNDKGHKHSRLSWKENGQGYVRAIPKEDVEWVLEMTANHKLFKKRLLKLVQTQKQLKSELDIYLEKAIKKTKGGRKYLQINK